MRVITLNPLYAEPNRYVIDQPKYITYEGNQVSAPKWSKAGTIALTTGNPNYPVRVIDADIIVSVDEVEITKVIPKTDVRSVTVEGSKGQTYVVTITPSGRTCTCQGFEFRRNCKHLNMICD